jgi:nitroimidazol reductase NimA-like FMN-containing flavoprotein (pyridoxamine 5'-phosphate oxidase superfamily)
MKVEYSIPAASPVRRRELTEDQVNSILLSQAFGRLACTDGERPYIVPITYAYDGKYIYGQTNEGTKLELMRKNPSVCFEVDRMTDMKNWKSVIVYGKFEELKGEAAHQARAKFFGRLFPLTTSNSIHSFQHEIDYEPDDSMRIKKVMFRIKIEKLTGRFEKP